MSDQIAKPEEKICQICGKTTPTPMVKADSIRPVLVVFIQQDAGHWDKAGWICQDDLEIYRYKYVEKLIIEEKGELTQLEAEILSSLRENTILAKNPEEEFETQLTFGQKVADKIADFGGSWRFIFLFGFIILVWMVTNTIILAKQAFDPYPFILLNLVLSTLAAIQAPVIMMSQNRQEARDRQRSLHDYQVNLKAELEIRQLHQKVDHLLSQQWERLAEIQEVQIEILKEIRDRVSPEQKN